MVFNLEFVPFGLIFHDIFYSDWAYVNVLLLDINYIDIPAIDEIFVRDATSDRNYQSGPILHLNLWVWVLN